MTHKRTAAGKNMMQYGGTWNCVHAMHGGNTAIPGQETACVIKGVAAARRLTYGAHTARTIGAAAGKNMMQYGGTWNCVHAMHGENTAILGQETACVIKGVAAARRLTYGAHTAYATGAAAHMMEV